MAPDAVVEDAADAGYRPGAARVAELVREGRPVLVRCARAGARETDPVEELALVSVYAWYGARVFATAHPRSARRALDMVASVRGERPPAVARRGLV